MNTASLLWALWGVTQPVITLVVTTVGTALAGVISAQMIRFLHIKSEDQKADFEAKLRDALHKSIDNGIGLAKAEFGKAAIETVSDKAVTVALDYVKSKNPKVVKKLKATDDILADLIKAKIGKER